MVSRMTLLLALSLSWCGLGCVQNPALPTAPPPQPKPKPPEPVVGTKESPKTKRTPKVTTYVAWGQRREQEAEDKYMNPSHKMDLYDDARQVYQAALKIDPKHLPAYIALARVYMKMNHYDKALETYKQT